MRLGEARPILKRRAVERGRKISNTAISLILSFVVTAAAQSERINQEGRILGPARVVTTPTLFNTPQADAIVSAMQIFPVTNPWNEDISRRPLLSNSTTMISQLKSDLSSTRQTLRPFYEMNYVLVPDNQARVTIPFLDYPVESDLDGGVYPNGSYPIPSNMPIETWPRETRLADSATMANGRDQCRRGSAWNYCRAWRWFDLGNVADEIDEQRLASVQRRQVRSQFQCAAARRLDFRRCRGPADVSCACALR